MAGNKAIHLALMVVVAMWGLVFVGIAELLPIIDALQLVEIRFTLIALVFVVIFLVMPSTRPTRMSWREFGIFAIVGLVAVPASQLTIVNGQYYLSPPLVSLVVTTSPAWAALFAAVWLKERVRVRQRIGFLIALAGVSLVILFRSGGSSLSVDNPWGALVTLGSPIAWALYTVMSKPLTQRYNPLTAVGIAMISGALWMLPLAPHAIRGIPEITPTGWLWMAYLVIGGTVIPYLVWFTAIKRLGAATTTGYMYGIPLAALGWAWVVLDIRPSMVALVGGAVITTGVALIQAPQRPAAPSPEVVPTLP